MAGPERKRRESRHTYLSGGSRGFWRPQGLDAALMFNRPRTKPEITWGRNLVEKELRTCYLLSLSFK